MATNQWDENGNPLKPTPLPDEGAGSYTPGSVISYNPKTGRYEPTKPQTGAPGGGAGAPGGGAGSPGGAAPAAKTGASVLGKTIGGASVLDWLAFATSVYESQKKGSFQFPPMSPEQKQMLDWAMGVLKQTPNTAAMAMPILQHDLSNRSTLDINALKRGETGYTPGARMSAAELAKIIGGGATTPPPTGP